ncbi:MAG: hypothetical protein K2I66_03175 [Bacteroidales bacterium]|nr:hypothetical protein [Bacteroidales bacterium]
MKKHLILWFTIALYAIGVLLLCNKALFWDSIQIISEPATLLYESGFSDWTLPDGSVTDNLALSAVVTLWWMIFGRTLFSTHILFGIFGALLIWQIYGLCRDVLSRDKQKALPWLFALVVSDAAVVTQSLVPMFDTVMILVAVWLMRAVLKDRRGSMIAASICLVMLRSRGVLLCAGFGLMYLILHGLPRTMKVFLPAFFTTIALLVLQFFMQGKLFGIGENSIMSVAAPSRILRNAFIGLPRFLLESGRLFVWGVLFVLVWKLGWKRSIQSIPHPISIGFVCFFVLLVVMTVPFRNPFGPRYFMILFILLELIAGLLIFEAMPLRKGRWVALALTVLLWGGHGVRYPEGIAVSWDTTLAHLPYYSLREEVKDYMQGMGISPKEVRAGFPYALTLDLTDLNGCEKGEIAYEEFSQCDTAQYILYSNISNGTLQEAGVTEDYELEKSFKRGYVYFRLYTRSR